MKNKKMMVVGFISAITLTFTLSTSLGAKSNAQNQSTGPSLEASRLESLAKFTKVLSIVEQYNVDGLGIDELIDKSFLISLDIILCSFLCRFHICIYWEDEGRKIKLKGDTYAIKFLKSYRFPLSELLCKVIK